MANPHIFIASGEACPQCEGLHGAEVEPGFRPHENCNCNTLPRPDGGECTFDVEEYRSRPTSDGDLMVDMTVTVTCPDGHTQSGSTSARLSSFLEDTDTVEEFMLLICEEYCGGPEGQDEFLCC